MKNTFRIILFDILIKCFLLLTAYILLPTVSYAQVIWGPDVRLTYLNEGTVYSPRITDSSDTLHIVWYQRFIVDTVIVTEVMYKRSTDRGGTWTQDTILSPLSPGASNIPDIAVSGSVVHVAWKEEAGDSILYTRSTNSGRDWEIPRTLSPSGFPVDIGVSGDTVLVYWGTTTAAYLSISTDAGFSWLPAQQVPKDRASIDDAIAVCLPFLHLTFQGNTVPIEILYQRSTDIGQTWSLPIMLSEPDMWTGQIPSIATDNDSNVYVDWWDYKESPYAWTGSIFLRKGVNNGTAWDTIQNLTTLYRARISDIAVQDSNVHVVWMDHRDYPGSPFDSFEIYYRYSSDKGNTWGPETRLTYEPHQSTTPRLAVDSGFVYLVWADNRDLDSAGRGYEVYFKRGDYEGGIDSKQNGELCHLVFYVYPNPSQCVVNCYCDLLKSQAWTIDIFDILGRKVRQYAGSGKRGDVIWDGKDEKGKEVRSGVYFIRLQTGIMIYQQKVVLLKRM